MRRKNRDDDEMRPAPDREAFLARQCGDDAELREEVRTLLVADGEAESSLSHGRRPADHSAGRGR